MRRSLGALACAATLSLGVLTTGAATAQSGPSQALADAQARALPGESFAQYRGRHGHGGGRVGGHRGYHGHHHHGRGGRGVGAAAAGLGLAAGLLGAAIVAQQPAPAPVMVGGGGRGWTRYCFQKFGPTFDPGSGTYLAADGYRYPCQ